MKLTFSNCVYEGEVVDGKTNGVGVLKFNNGNVCIGEFLNNQINGYGEYKFTNGDRFRGFFINGKRHGLGIFECDKYVVQGEYVNDKRNGQFCEILCDGTIVCGGWKDGERFGDSITYNLNRTAETKRYGMIGESPKVVEYREDVDLKKIERSVENGQQQILNAFKERQDYVYKKLKELFPDQEFKKEEIRKFTKQTPIQSQPNDKIEQPTFFQKVSERLKNSKKQWQENRQHKKEEKQRLQEEQQRIAEENRRKANELIEKAVQYHQAKDMQNALYYLFLAKQQDNSEFITRKSDSLTYSIKGKMCFDEGSYKPSLEFYSKARDCCCDEKAIEQIDEMIGILSDKINYDEAIKLYREEEFEESLDLFYKIKFSTKDPNMRSVSHNMITKLEKIVKELRAERDRLAIEANYRKAKEKFDLGVECYNNNEYYDAIEYFKEAKKISIDSNLIEECDEYIESCRNLITAEKNDKAIELYNKGIEYFNNQLYYDAKSKFKEARNLSEDYDFRKTCSDLIFDCEEAIKEMD